MSAAVFNDRNAYLQNTYFQFHKRERGDFTPFYITVSVCTVLLVSIIVLNVVLGCWSRYSTYWNDRHTGNRWIVSLWTSTPHLQPSLDYTELQYVDTSGSYHEPAPAYTRPSAPPIEYSKVESFELQQKRESAI